MPQLFADAIDHQDVTGVARIVAGESHTCIRTGTGKLRCWGDAQRGQIGYGNAQDVGHIPRSRPYIAGDVPLLADEVAAQLVAGQNHTCALLDTGLVRCWGGNDRGQLGYGRTDDLGDGEPITAFGYVSLGGTADKIAAGAEHTCAVTSDGKLQCWGLNSNGQLGYGDTTNRGTPSGESVDIGDTTAFHIAAGWYHTCALGSNGQLRCWGAGGGGRLGHGLTSDLRDPFEDIFVFTPDPVPHSRHCREILGRDPSATDGIYTIAPGDPGGSGTLDVYCDTTAENGGWTLVANIAADGNHYWTWGNRANLYNGATYGTLSGPFNQDFQSAAWHRVASQELLLEADASSTKYVRYDTIMYSQPLSSRYPSGLQIVGTFEPQVVSGSWWYQCGSLGMRLMTPDSDPVNEWDTAAVGFVWKSNNNHGCSWDDVYGGVNYSSNPGVESWGGWFYSNNFSASLNAFVR